MSSKKLIAAAMAAIMTVGTVSAVTASATQGVDEWTIDGTGAGSKQVDEAKVTPYFAVALKDLGPAGNSMFTTIKNKTEDKGNDYNKELGLALWTPDDANYKFKDFKGGTATLYLEATAAEYVQVQVIERTGPATATATDKVSLELHDISQSQAGAGKSLYVPKLKDGYVFAMESAEVANITDWSDYTKNTAEMKIVKSSDYGAKSAVEAGEPTPPAPTVAAAAMSTFKVLKAEEGTTNAGKYMAASTVAAAGTANAAAAVSTTTITTTETQTIASGMRTAGIQDGATNIMGTDKAGKQTSTVQFTPAFGNKIGNTVRLEEFNLAKSSITIDVSGTVDHNTWENYYKNKWALQGSKDWTWTWLTNPGEFNGSLNPEYGLALLVGQSGVLGQVAKTPKTFKSDPELTESNPDYIIPRTLPWTITSGSGTSLSFGNLVPPAVLKALNDGGTLTFEFTRELKGTEYFFGTMVFGYNNGTSANSITIEPTYGNGKTATIEIPAGLTYYKDEKNPWQNVGIGWNFEFQTLGNALLTSNGALNVGADNKTDKDIVSYLADKTKGVDIVKMTFTAKGAKVDNTSGSTTSNGGNTSGSGNSGNKTDNPGTGVALAIAPAVLAAGAFVVVASKKRK